MSYDKVQKSSLKEFSRNLCSSVVSGPLGVMSSLPAPQTLFRRLSVAILAVATVLGLASCSKDEIPIPTPTSTPLAVDGIVIITNSHANVPVPELTEGKRGMVSSALQQGLPVIIVSADGTPELVDLGKLKVEGNNPTTYRKSLENALRLIARGIAVLPNADGASSYEAFAVAVNKAISAGMKHPAFICIACGLDTMGPLNMTQDGMLSAEVKKTVESLASEGQLVSFREPFTKAEVHLVSTGSTAPPQEGLTQRQKRMLTDLWSQVLKAGGAEVHVDPHPLTGEAVKTEFTVPIVTLPPEPVRPIIPACKPEPQPFDESSGVRFQPDQDQWVDESAAREDLTPIAEWLTSDPSRTAVISGTSVDIRSGNPNEGKALSLARARKAADLFVELGVARSQITDMRGLGPHFPGRVEDREPNGTPIPHLQAKNRKIIVDLTSSC